LQNTNLRVCRKFQNLIVRKIHVTNIKIRLVGNAMQWLYCA
jgi:hypothetical protein